MTTRVVEGKKPYTGGTAIDIDENKVISLRLRDENNLIIYDEGDDEIYVDLQLPDEITPTDAFPIGVNTGRVVVDNGWDKAGTIISAKTTSGDVIKLVYADEGTLWIDNGTGTFKQIYFKSDVDAIITTLTTYINTELAKKQNGVASTTAPSNPSEGDLWYDTTNSAMKVWDGTAWQSVGTGGGGSDIEYVTQAEYTALLPGALTDGKHYFIYSTSGGWQPGVNTIAYYPLDSTNTVNDLSGNNYTLTTTHTSPTFGTYQGVDCASFNGSNTELQTASVNPSVYGNQFTISCWLYSTATNTDQIPINNTYYGGGYYNWTIRAHSSRSYYYSFNLDCNSSYKAGNGWANLVFTYDNGTIKSYTNGVYNNTGTLSLSLSNNGLFTIGAGHDENGDSWYCWYNGGLSNIIVEDKVWTGTEINDYYDQTKANYGIS